MRGKRSRRQIEIAKSTPPTPSRTSPMANVVAATAPKRMAAADLKTELKSASDLSNDPEFGPSFRALVAESQHDRRLATQLLERIFWPRVEAAKERLRAAQVDGQLATAIDLDLAVDLLYGAFYYRYLLRAAPLTHEHAEAVVEAVLTGIGSREFSTDAGL
jgi:Tetracyclin repressor-like, C-terminal domain